ncbi:MAG: alpha/beta fold hydrolase, partial [Acidimicrobiales bacterium]
LAVIGPLTDPRMDGGDPADAFDVVIPSIPGHGFSVPLSKPGWTHEHMARAFIELMARLGYHRYGVHGGDHSAFQALVGRMAPDQVIGVHVDTSVTHQHLHEARRPTMPHTLTDSPVGLLAWIVGTFQERAEAEATLPDDVVDRDHVLTDVSVCWFNRDHTVLPSSPFQGGGHSRAMTRPERLVADVRTFFRNPR